MDSKWRDDSHDSRLTDAGPTCVRRFHHDYQLEKTWSSTWLSAYLQLYNRNTIVSEFPS